MPTKPGKFESRNVARLVEIFGNMSAVGRALKVDRQTVFLWKRAGYVPREWALEVARVTGGQVSVMDVLLEADEASPPKSKLREALAVSGGR